MNKQSVRELSKITGYSYNKVDKMFDCIHEFIRLNMMERKRILLNGFGSLRIKRKYEEK